jgi:hypothetical protein
MRVGCDSFERQEPQSKEIAKSQSREDNAKEIHW